MLLPSDDGNAPFTRFASFAKQEPPGQPTQLPYRTIQLVSSMLRESHKVFLFLPTTLLPTPHSLLRLGLQMRALALNRRADLATLRWIGNRLSDRIQAFYYPLEGTTSVECACAFISESSTETASLNKTVISDFPFCPTSSAAAGQRSDEYLLNFFFFEGLCVCTFTYGLVNESQQQNFPSYVWPTYWSSTVRWSRDTDCGRKQPPIIVKRVRPRWPILTGWNGLGYGRGSWDCEIVCSLLCGDHRLRTPWSVGRS